GAVEKARLVDPGGAGHLAVAVQREPAGEDGIRRRLAAREDPGHASAHRLALDEGGHADFHAAHVRDGVEGTGGPFEGNAEIARAGFRHACVYRISPAFAQARTAFVPPKANELVRAMRAFSSGRATSGT